MRCEFCGDKLEGEPFFKEGMAFCSLECADAMESGEAMPVDKRLLDDPDDYDDEEYEIEDLDDDDDEEDEDELEELQYDDVGDDDLYDDDKYGLA